MTDSLLADLRALATHNGSPVNPENLRWAATHESLCRSWIFDVLMGMADLIDKHAPEPDVSERDELARVIARELGCIRKGEIGGHSMCGEHHYGWLSTGECPVQERITDAILAAGWRKR